MNEYRTKEKFNAIQRHSKTQFIKQRLKEFVKL